MEFLYHYTSLEVLALILKNRTIRFNSLSNVDDSQEKLLDKLKDIGNQTLVTCWTRDSQENIPLWKMYSDDYTGCRLQVKEDMFIFRNRGQEDDSYIILNPNEENLLLIPQDFLRDIEYVDELSKRNIIGKEATYVIGMLGREKEKVWGFQKECRFRIYQFHDKKTFEKLFKEQYEEADYNTGLKYDYYDVELRDDALDNIIVTLGPKCNEGHKIIVETLLEQYTKNGRVEYSTLKNKLN